MADYLWPPDLIPASQNWRVIDNAAVFQSPLTGSLRTVARSGARMGCTITMDRIRGQDRARITALLGALRGKSNRIWMPDFSSNIRGSFPATELLNNDFSTAVNWAISGGTTSAADRALRVTYDGGAGPISCYQTLGSGLSYGPHAFRVSCRDVVGSLVSGSAILHYIEGTPEYATAVPSGLATAYAVMDPSGSSQFLAYSTNGGHPTNARAGDAIDFFWASMARCALVDNGPNLLTNSDNASGWGSGGVTTSTDNQTAPDGTITADTITETATSGSHYVGITGPSISSAGHYCGVVFAHRGALTRDVEVLVGTTGSGNYAGCAFNLSTGAMGTPFIGGTATNARAYCQNVGNGWFACFISAWLPAAATRADVQIGMMSGGTDNYTGSTGSVYLWRAGVANSGIPFNPSKTTTSTTTGTSQTGNKLNIKGLPINTSGLLRAGDYVQIGNQINQVINSLDSNAAGLGTLQCAIPWRQSPADGSPVIIYKPMAKMILASDDISWDTEPGQYSPFQLELVEDVT